MILRQFDCSSARRKTTNPFPSDEIEAAGPMSANRVEGVGGATSTPHFSAALLFLLPVARLALFSEPLVTSMIATSTKLRAFAL